MSRLKKADVNEREVFVRELFKSNPAMTGSCAQDKIKEKFGKIMRPNRIYELKRAAMQEFAANQALNTENQMVTFASVLGKAFNKPSGDVVK